MCVFKLLPATCVALCSHWDEALHLVIILRPCAGQKGFCGPGFLSQLRLAPMLPSVSQFIGELQSLLAVTQKLPTGLAEALQGGHTFSFLRANTVLRNKTENRKFSSESSSYMQTKAWESLKKNSEQEGGRCATRSQLSNPRLTGFTPVLPPRMA